MSPENQITVLPTSQQHIINPTNPGSTLHYSIKDRLHVGWGLADDLQDMVGGRLLFEGLGLLAGLLL